MFKGEKGITLIALAITIIVLLILAGISITALTNGGILTQAGNARDSYSRASAEESSKLTKFSESLSIEMSKVSSTAASYSLNAGQ